MKNITLSALAFAALSTFTFAGGDIAPVVEPVIEPMVDDSGFYLGLGTGIISARDSDTRMNFFSDETRQDRLGSVTVLAGYDFNAYIGLEGRYTASLYNDDIVDMNGWSIFVKPQYPVTDAFSIYALLGYGNVELDDTRTNFTDVDDSGFQWGIGASYAFNDAISIFVDYTALTNNADDLAPLGTAGYAPSGAVDVDALTLGMTYKF